MSCLYKINVHKFSKFSFCTLQPIPFSDSPSLSPTLLKHVSFPGCSSLEHSQWLLMPCELKFKLFNNGPSAPHPPACPACHLAYGTDLATIYCLSIRHTNGPLEIVFIPQNQLRQPCGSGSLVGLFSSWWCPAFSSQRVFRRPLKCQSWILFLPLALSALPCLPWHPQGPSPC